MGHYAIVPSRPAGRKHESSIGLTFTTSAKHTLISREPVSDRIVTAKLRPTMRNISIVQYYAPTETSDMKEAEVFPEQLIVVGLSYHLDGHVLREADLESRNDNDERFYGFLQPRHRRHNT